MSNLRGGVNVLGLRELGALHIYRHMRYIGTEGTSGRTRSI